MLEVQSALGLDLHHNRRTGTRYESRGSLNLRLYGRATAESDPGCSTSDVVTARHLPVWAVARAGFTEFQIGAAPDLFMPAR